MCYVRFFFPECSFFILTLNRQIPPGIYCILFHIYIETVNQSCFSGKLFYEYLVKLHENIHAKALLQLSWNHTSTWVLFCTFTTYLQRNVFLEVTSGELLFHIVLNIKTLNLEVVSKQIKNYLKHISIF